MGPNSSWAVLASWYLISAGAPGARWSQAALSHLQLHFVEVTSIRCRMTPEQGQQKKYKKPCRASGRSTSLSSLSCPQSWSEPLLLPVLPRVSPSSPTCSVEFVPLQEPLQQLEERSNHLLPPALPWRFSDPPPPQPVTTYASAAGYRASVSDLVCAEAWQIESKRFECAPFRPPAQTPFCVRGFLYIINVFAINLISVCCPVEAPLWNLWRKIINHAEKLLKNAHFLRNVIVCVTRGGSQNSFWRS